MRVRPSAPAPFAAGTRSRSLVRVWRAWPPRAKRSAAKARCGSGPPCGLRCAAWRAARCFDRPARGRRGPPRGRGPPAGVRRAAPLRGDRALLRPSPALAGRGQSAPGTPPAPFLGGRWGLAFGPGGPRRAAGAGGALLRPSARLGWPALWFPAAAPPRGAWRGVVAALRPKKNAAPPPPTRGKSAGRRWRLAPPAMPMARMCARQKAGAPSPRLFNLLNATKHDYFVAFVVTTYPRITVTPYIIPLPIRRKNPAAPATRITDTAGLDFSDQTRQVCSYSVASNGNAGRPVPP